MVDKLSGIYDPSMHPKKTVVVIENIEQILEQLH
jgi:hypothetical protein